jgi:pseudouridine kinase
VADVAIVEQQLTPSLIASLEPQIRAAKLLVLDANLSRDSIRAAARAAATWGVPVLLEPVSVPKAAR